MLAKIPATINVSIFLLQVTAGSGKFCVKVASFQFKVNVLTSELFRFQVFIGCLIVHVKHGLDNKSRPC